MNCLSARSTRTAIALAIAVTGGLFGAPLLAQAVRGTVRLPDGVTAAPNVVVLLLRATNDSVIARAATATRGTYMLRAPTAGEYRLRLLRLGQQPETVGPFGVPAGEPVTRNIVLVSRPITLARFDVRGKDQCRTRPDSGLLVAQLLAESRKALLASVVTSLDGESVSEYETFVRIEDTRERLLVPSRTRVVTRSTARPFASLPPDSLAKIGYVVSADDSVVYRGPDAEVLLSDAFAAGHCFQVVQGTGAREASIGVAFRPVAVRGAVVEIRGTIWMERNSGVLQSVEFTYDPMPDADRRAGIGGEVEFVRTESGLWIVKQWNIRMPRVVIRQEGAIPGVRPARTTRIVEGIQRSGGDVRLVRVGSTVHYRGALSPAVMASAGPSTVDVRPPVITDHPVCGVVGALSDSGAAGGRVSTDDTTGLAGAEVVARWRNSRLSSDARLVSYQDHERRATTLPGGEYVLCGLPLDQPITLVVSRNGQRSLPTSLRVTIDSPVATSDVRVAKSFADAAIDPDSTKARLRLRVRSTDGAGVPDAEITLRVQEVARTVRSDNDGDAYFVDLPPGVAEIGVRRIGSVARTVRAAIEVGRNELTVQLSGTTVVLEGVRVIGNREVSARHAEVDARILRGEASAVVTRKDIERRNPIKLSQMLRTLAGLRIADSSGATVAISTRGQKVTREGAVVPCVMRVMMDGILMSESNDIDNVVPVEVYAVEVFYGAASIPPQFAGTRAENWCGLIAVWTR